MSSVPLGEVGNSVTLPVVSFDTSCCQLLVSVTGESWLPLMIKMDLNVPDVQREGFISVVIRNPPQHIKPCQTISHTCCDLFQPRKSPLTLYRVLHFRNLFLLISNAFAPPQLKS